MRVHKILLTGASGMVGRNLLDHPGLQAFDVLTPTSSQLNLLNFDGVLAYLQSSKPDLIVHAAGRVGGIQANMREPLRFLVDNLDMGRNLVMAARHVGVSRLINLGSSCMYPRNHSEPLEEEMVLKGEMESTNEGYALSKVVTARLCDYIRREDSSLQYKTLIPCNLYGSYDKFDPLHSHLIPAIILKVHLAKQTGQPTVEIWGDGQARREFMYASDLADALLRAITHFETLPDYMNVGMGHDHTINEYYQATADVMGYKGGFIHDTTKPVGMARKLVSISRQTTWGWSASHDLRSGIQKTYGFYLKGLRQ